MNIFKLELRTNYKSFLIWVISCAFLMILYLAFFPSMSSYDMSSLLGGLSESLPAGFMEGFGISAYVDFSRLPNFLGMVMSEMNLALVIYGAYLGCVMLVKEESEGTIEYLYSMPVTRTRIFIEKLLVIILMYFVFILSMFGVCLVGSLWVTTLNNKELWDIVQIFMGTLFSGYVFMAIGYLLSVLLKTTRQAMAVSIGIVFTTFILGTMSGMIEKLEWMKYLSPLKYGEASDIVSNGFNGTYILIGFFIIIISLVLGFFLYQKKEFKV